MKFLILQSSSSSRSLFHPPRSKYSPQEADQVSHPYRTSDKIVVLYFNPPSDSEVKNAWKCIYTPPYVYMAWGVIKQGETLPFKVKENLYFMCLTKHYAMKK
jgi:hypothetical protein